MNPWNNAAAAQPTVLTMNIPANANQGFMHLRP